MMGKIKRIGVTTKSFIYAVAIHVVVAVLLVASFNWETVVVATPPASNIEPVKATVVTEAEIQEQLDAIKKQEKEKKQEELKAKQKLEDMLRQAKEAEKKRKAEQKRLAEVEKKKKLEEEQAKLALQKRKAEELRMAKLKKEQEAKEAKAEAERKQREAAERKRRNEQKRLAEEKRRKEIAEKKRREQELAEKKRREAELQARLEEERLQRRYDEALSQFTPIIQQKVSRNWSRPPGSQLGLTAGVRVRLTPSGEVISAQVVRSSGNSLFDRSVENAVLKASPLPIPQEQQLNQRFREIQFNFNPDQKLISKS